MRGQRRPLLPACLPASLPTYRIHSSPWRGRRPGHSATAPDRGHASTGTSTTRVNSEVNDVEDPGPTRLTGLSDAIQRAEGALAKHQEMTAKLQEVSGNATSDNRMVTVRVGQQGV